MSGKNSKAPNAIQTQLRPGQQTATTPSSEPSAPAEAASTHANLDPAALKLVFLASLRKDIADIFKKKLQDTLGDALSTIKLDLQAVKTQLANDKAATDATMSKLTGTVGEMEHALTERSDDIAEMKTTTKCLTANVAKLENKCEDLESRSRRNNIRIVGVPEGPDTCTTTAVAALLREAFTLVKEPLLDRSHRTLQPKPKPGDCPRVIVCRFHYHSDCVDILRRVRELRQIKVRDLTISVFPDYTAKTARARFSSTDVITDRNRAVPNDYFSND
uniref:L1 transposable element RRM domain-containing protein n=1 Tax=Sparus aurata TaxID=8175 RepID=A0A671URW1_SPAAU